MAWDKNETALIGLTLVCMTVLAALKVITEASYMVIVGMIVGYLTGRIINHSQGKEK